MVAQVSVEPPGDTSSSAVSATSDHSRSEGQLADSGDGDRSVVPTASVPTPYWCSEKRELVLAGRLVKRFRVPSPNQETVLAAFQEEAWPIRIDDPLPVHSDIVQKRRLQDTIKSLNPCESFADVFHRQEICCHIVFYPKG